MKESKHSNFLLKKPLYAGFIAGVLIIVLFLISAFFNQTIVQNVVPILNAVLYLVFIYAIYCLGKIYDSKFLRVLAVISIVLMAIGLLAGISFNVAFPGTSSKLISIINQTAISLNVPLESIQALNESQQQEFGVLLMQNIVADSQLKNALITIAVLAASALILFILLGLCFGIAFIRLRDKISLANAVGILTLVGIGLTITLIGFLFGIFVLFASFVILIIALSREAKKHNL